MGSTPVTPIVPELLISYKNYEQWSFRVQTYLMAEKLWYLVQPSTGETGPQEDGEDYRDWTSNNAKALYVIQNSCGSDMLSLITTTFRAKDAWEALENDCKAKQKVDKDVEEFKRYIPFFDFVGYGEWEKAERCLKELPDAVRMRDPRDGYRDTALHLAAREGQLQTVKWLMSLMTQEDILSKNAIGRTALHVAITKGHLEIVKVLVPVMGQVKYGDGDTSLHIATDFKHVHIVKELKSLMTQEDLRLKNNKGYTALHVAVVVNCLDIVKELFPVMGEIKDCHGSTTLHFAVHYSKACIVKELVKLMKRENLEIRNDYGYTVLDLALENKDVPILKELVYNDDHFDCYIPFTDFVSKGDWENAKECLRGLESYVHDAIRARDPRDECRNTALHVAAKQGHAYIVKELVLLMMQRTSKGKKVDGVSEEETVIQKAKYLIEMKECVLEQRNAFGETALHLAVRNEHVHVVKELVKFMRKEGYEVKDKTGSTALHQAVSMIQRPMNVEILKELVSHMRKEGFEVKDKAGYTALHRVVSKGNLEIVEMMVPFMREEGYEVKDEVDGYTALHRAVAGGNVEIVKQLVSCMRQEGLNVRDAEGSHALHCAVKAEKMHISIVKELVSAMSLEALKIKDYVGYTTLGLALKKRHPEKDVKEMAKYMAEKTDNVFAIEMPNNFSLPVVMACLFGKVELTRYLYSHTPPEAFKEWNGSYLISVCIKHMSNLDIALHLLQRYPRLALQCSGDVDFCPILILARMNYTFLSGTRLAFWQKWIYNNTKSLQPLPEFNTDDAYIDVSKTKTDGRRVPFSVGKLFKRYVEMLRKYLGIDHVYKMKYVHLRVGQFLDCIRKLRDTNKLSKEESDRLKESVFKALEKGHFEFVTHMFKAQEFMDINDEEDRDIFHMAIEHRQANIYRLIYSLDHEQRNERGRLVDNGRNSILHAAGKPSVAARTRLDQIQGASLQMQRELQWFKEVESIVPLDAHEIINRTDQITGRELFTRNHKELMEEAEKSIKATASSCTVVGSLIATMMFAAAFTVPGGNNDNTGIPMFVDKDLFLAFIISDTLSLVSSTTSVIIFLGLLTSRYAEDDYLTSLPKKMMLGLFTLFMSIATMMIAFSYALIIMLREEYSWIITPTIILGSVPILSFVWVQFPLLYKTLISTYGPGIFEKEARRPWYKTLMKAVVSCLGFSKSQPN